MKKRLRSDSSFVPLVGTLLVMLLTGALFGFSSVSSASPVADLAPTAEAYRIWLLAAMDHFEADLPAISQSAQAAADRFVAGRNLSVRGGAGMLEELNARAGGLCDLPVAKSQPGDVVMYFFGVATERYPSAEALLEKELTDAEALVADGSMVIGFASFKQLAAFGLLERARSASTFLLDNFAPSGDGLFPNAEGLPTIPTFVTVDAIAAWTWTAEFFAACTRAGRTPTMFQSILNDPERTRYVKYKPMRFHDDLNVAPVPVGQLGLSYLTEIRRLLAVVRETAWPALAEAAQRAAQTLRDGGQVYISAHGHYPPYHHGGKLPTDRSDFRRLIKPKPGSTSQAPEPGSADYGVAIGYSVPPDDAFWGGADTVLRQAGHGVCWVISGHRMQPDSLRPNELLVDQCWPDGDASVAVPGYDVNICPPSGVMSEALMWMLTAEVWAQNNDVRPAPVP